MLIKNILNKNLLVLLLTLINLKIYSAANITDSSTTNNTLESQIICAVKNNNIQKLETLLEPGNELLDALDKNSDSILIIAARNGYEDIVRFLIDYGATVNYANDDGYTALLAASFNCHISIVKLLIDAKADVNLFTKTGHTALLFAVLFNSLDLAKLLLNSGANIEAKKSDKIIKDDTELFQKMNNKTVYDLAIFYNRSGIIELFNKFKKSN